jgi:hypothetical protein
MKQIRHGRPLTAGVAGLLVVAGTLAGAPRLSSAAEAVKPVFDWQTGDTFEFRATDTGGEVRVPIVRAPGMGAPSFSKSGVLLEGRQDQSWNDGFKAVLMPADAKWGEHLLITVFTNQIKFPGKYALSLIASAAKLSHNKKTSEETVVQRATLYLVHPDAVVRVVGDLIVERVFWLPWVEKSARETKPELSLEETGPWSHATQVTAQSVGAATVQGEPAITLKFPSSGAISLAPQGMSPLTYTVSGSTLGTAKGTFEISAPQLRAKVSVPYEVRSRLSGIWILFLTGIGTWLGYWGRTGLAQILDRMNARSEAKDLASKVDEEIAAARDAVLKKKLEAIVPSLNAMANSTTETTENIQKVLKIQREALDAARNDLAARRLEATLSLASLAAVAADWQLPSALRMVLERAASPIKAAREALEEGAVATAQAGLMEANAALENATTGLPKAVAAWRRAMEKLASQMLGLGQRLPTWAVGQLESAVTSSLQLLGEAASGALSQRDELEKLQQGRDVMRQAADWILEILAAEANDVLSVTVGAASPAQRERIEGARTAMDADRDTPVEGRTMDKARPLIDAMDELARDLAKAVSPDEVDAVNAAIDGHLYADACRRAVALGRRPAAPVPAGKELLLETEGAGQREGFAATAAANAILRIAPSFSKGLFASSLRLAIGNLTPAPEITRTIIQRAVTRLVRIQRAISAAVVIGTAYFLYGSTFIGTPVEVIGLIFFGFASDLTIESATTLAASKRR